jgi:lantibiotic modifying enzyme
MSSECLAAAANAAREIVDDAVWYDGRCSWMGATTDAGAHLALGPTLYKGTAGVGLFLAHVASATGDADARRTALGALRHALGGVSRLPRDSEGFHVGATGVAWAAVMAGAVLDAPELHEAARAALQIDRGESSDVLTGTAGTILGLLALAGPLDDPSLVDRAAEAGDELLADARADRDGWSWPTPHRGSRRHLFGLGHGSSGIAWALLELAVASGDARFRAGAERGFAYERSWLDERSGRWAHERRHGSQLGSTGSWCHGEAGIALTRRRAADLLGSEAHRHDAELAVATTRRWLVEELRDGVVDLSLCHGATGAAEVAQDAALTGELAAFALERDPREWPGGVSGGTTPALFRGTSGIAWWLLRIHDPAIPSPIGLTVGTVNN